jgi:hypothetical protein
MKRVAGFACWFELLGTSGGIELGPDEKEGPNRE